MIDESLIQIRKMEESDVYDELYDLIVKTDNKRCLEKLETKIFDIYHKNAITQQECSSLLDLIEWHPSINVEPACLFDHW